MSAFEPKSPMHEWYDSQKKPSSDWRKKLEELTNNNREKRKLGAEERTRLTKLECIADKLRRGDNPQNRQLKRWLTEDEYEKIDDEWQSQKEIREELKSQ